jgi:hypothetical protein
MSGFTIGKKYVSPHANTIFKRNPTMELAMEIIDIPLADCKIRFLDNHGDDVEPGKGDLIRSHQFVVDCDYIDPMLVKSAEIKLDYGDSGVACVRVTTYVKEGTREPVVSHWSDNHPEDFATD